jgi:hypothetical protein
VGGVIGFAVDFPHLFDAPAQGVAHPVSRIR